MTNRLTYTIEVQDLNFSEQNGIPPEYCVFQKIYNPLVLFCRLMDLDLETDEAMRRVKVYERMFYNPMMDSLGEKLK